MGNAKSKNQNSDDSDLDYSDWSDDESYYSDDEREISDSPSDTEVVVTGTGANIRMSRVSKPIINQQAPKKSILKQSNPPKDLEKGLSVESIQYKENVVGADDGPEEKLKVQKEIVGLFQSGTKNKTENENKYQDSYVDLDELDHDSENSLQIDPRNVPSNEIHNIAQKARKKPPKMSFLGAAKKVIWSTNWTQDRLDPEHQQLTFMESLKNNIREISLYILFFLSPLLYLSIDMSNSTHFYYSDIMRNLLTQTFNNIDGNSFESMNEMDHWWNYMSPDGPFINAIYWDKWYNNEKLPDWQNNHIFYENRLLGVPRIRQLRVKNGTCQIHPEMNHLNIFNECYSEYSVENQDTEHYFLTEDNPFSALNLTAWKFQSEDDLHGSSHYSALTDKEYDGSGFVQDLSITKQETLRIIDELHTLKWLDRGTRAVFIDFTVYNSNINLFCVVHMLSEFPATGGQVTSAEFRAVKMLNLDDFEHQVLRVFEYFSG